MKYIFLFCFLSALIVSCRTDKPPFADVYVVFNYTGSKIDTSTIASDQIIFRNVDGTLPVYVPVSSTNLCDDKVFIGTYALEDTLEWHLRLVYPDGDPANFKLYFNQNRELVLINQTLHFIKPSNYDFTVKTEMCGSKTVVVIGN